MTSQVVDDNTISAYNTMIP